MKFFYCAAGPEGDPVLVIRPSIEEDDIHTLKMGAQKQAFARGEVIPSANGLVFESNPSESNAGASSLLEQDLKRYFSKKVSALQNARVITNTHGDFIRAK